MWLEFLPSAVAATVLAGSVSLIAYGATPEADDTYCGVPANDPDNVHDYRMRYSTPTLKFKIEDNMLGHTDPAIKRMRAGEYSRNVMADLDYTLMRWPNHLQALRALIDYDLAGGKPYEFMPAHCYIERARKFAPDDVNVALAQAYYEWKKGDTIGAVASYETALDIDPDSAVAHYNLGLLYFELGQYEKARDQAQAAYSAGYPLSGLRKKLAAAGYWKESADVE